MQNEARGVGGIYALWWGQGAAPSGGDEGISTTEAQVFYDFRNCFHLIKQLGGWTGGVGVGGEGSKNYTFSFLGSTMKMHTNAEFCMHTRFISNHYI